MSIKTRLDGRSSDNYGLSIICNETGKVIAKIESTAGRADLSIETPDGLHVKKTNGTVIKRRSVQAA